MPQIGLKFLIIQIKYLLMVICRKTNFLQHAKSHIGKTNICTKDPYELKYHLLRHKVENVDKAQRAKCPNTEFFLVCIFLYLDLYSVKIQKNKDQKKFHIWTLFTQWRLNWIFKHFKWCLYFTLIVLKWVKILCVRWFYCWYY